MSLNFFFFPCLPKSLDNNPEYITLKKRTLELELALESIGKDKEKYFKAYEETKKDLEYWHAQYKTLERDFNANQYEWNQQISIVSMHVSAKLKFFEKGRLLSRE